MCNTQKNLTIKILPRNHIRKSLRTLKKGENIVTLLKELKIVINIVGNRD